MDNGQQIWMWCNNLYDWTNFFVLFKSPIHKNILEEAVWICEHTSKKKTTNVCLFSIYSTTTGHYELNSKKKWKCLKISIE